MPAQPATQEIAYVVDPHNMPLRQVDPMQWDTMFNIVTNGYGRCLVIDDAGHVYVEFDGGNPAHWQEALRYINAAANATD